MIGLFWKNLVSNKPSPSPRAKFIKENINFVFPLVRLSIVIRRKLATSLLIVDSSPPPLFLLSTRLFPFFIFFQAPFLPLIYGGWRCDVTFEKKANVDSISTIIIRNATLLLRLSLWRWITATWLEHPPKYSRLFLSYLHTLLKLFSHPQPSSPPIKNYCGFFPPRWQVRAPFLCRNLKKKKLFLLLLVTPVPDTRTISFSLGNN